MNNHLLKCLKSKSGEEVMHQAVTILFLKCRETTLHAVIPSNSVSL